MTLKVEDGSAFADALTYVSEADVQAFAAARGRTVPSDTAVLGTLILRAMDWIEGQPFKGAKGSAAQALQWPRTGVSVYGFDLPTSGAGSIPKALTDALSLLVIEIAGGIELHPTQTEPLVIEETIGPITTKFSDKMGAIDGPVIPAVEQALKPIVNSGFSLTLTRA